MTPAEFLHHLYTNVDGGHLTIFAITTDGDRLTLWTDLPDGIDAIADKAADLDADVWFGVATRCHQLDGGRRGGADDCVAIPALWLDIDIAGPGHLTDHPLPPGVDAARTILDQYPHPPTAIVHSGGGLQAWWLLAEPLDTGDDADALLASWAHTWQTRAAALGWHVDNVFDVARVMRLPGTYNRKLDEPRPVTVIEADWGRTYGIDDLDTYLDAPPPPPEPTPTRRTPYTGAELPGDAYNARHSGSDVLGRLGFTLARRDRNGDEHWVRPGKDARQGTSATVYADDGHTTVWSDTCAAQWPGIAVRRPYDPFGLLVATVYRGDFSAAYADLLADGYGTPPERLDPADLLPDSDDAWPDPEPVGIRAIDERPPFPIETLPAWIADAAVELADSLQVPVDVPATIAIGALSALCSTRIKTKVKGSRWTESANLYLVLGMPPGSGKSPAYKAMTSPLQTIESEMVRAVKGDRSTALHLKAGLEKKAKAAADAIAKSDDPRGAAETAARYEAEAEAIDVPALPRLTADDATPEALVKLLANHGGRIAIMSPEGLVFDSIAGNYAEKGRRVNLDVFLKGFSGERIQRDRAGGDSDDVVAHVTICVTTQPAVITSMGADLNAVRRGVPPRFMFSIPEANIGYRDPDAQFDEDRRTDAVDVYADRLIDIGRRVNGWITPRTLEQDEDARLVWRDFYAETEARMRDGGDLSGMREWVPKLSSSVLRLAGILTIADGANTATVDGDTMRRAIAIGRYWIAHAQAVHALWENEGSAAGAARRMLEKLAVSKELGDERWSGDTITPRGIARIVSHRGSMTDLRDPIEELIDGHWLRLDGGSVLSIGLNDQGLGLTVRPGLSPDLVKEVYRNASERRGCRVSRIRGLKNNNNNTESHIPTSRHATTATTPGTTQSGGIDHSDDHPIDATPDQPAGVFVDGALNAFVGDDDTPTTDTETAA